MVTPQKSFITLVKGLYPQFFVITFPDLMQVHSIDVKSYNGNAHLPSVPEPGAFTREYYRGKYHCTVDLLFDWFGLVCFTNKNKNCQ
jgi:hypothetical protein